MQQVIMSCSMFQKWPKQTNQKDQKQQFSTEYKFLFVWAR